LVAGLTVVTAVADEAAAEAEPDVAAGGAVTAPPAEGPPEAQGPKEVVAGGIIILRIRVPAGGMTPEQRMAALYERAGAILRDQGVKPADVMGVQKGDTALVMAGRHLFATVTPSDAQANKTTPIKLAEIWASNLRIAMPLARPQATPHKGL